MNFLVHRLVCGFLLGNAWFQRGAELLGFRESALVALPNSLL